MPNMMFPKSALEPRPAFKSGIYDVMLKGLKPALSKNVSETTGEKSINLTPELVICNSAETFPDGKPYNGSKVFFSGNLSFLPAVQDMFHCFGEPLLENGDQVELPGSFGNGTTDPDPKNWGAYSGAVVNSIGQVEIVETPAQKKVGGQWVPDPGKTRSEIKRFICKVPGCTVQHLESLIRS